MLLKSLSIYIVRFFLICLLQVFNVLLIFLINIHRIQMYHNKKFIHPSWSLNLYTGTYGSLGLIVCTP
jgi:hypothetical protein